MLPGETQALLVKSTKFLYFPVPPPAPRDNTLYSCWKEFSCMGTDLPFWKQESSRSISWAANTYDCCMTPAIWYDRFIFKICCCGDSECSYCSCNDGWFLMYSGLIHIPKIPFVILSGTSALFTGTIGVIGDCVSPPRELMDESKPLFSDEKAFESKISLSPNNADDEKSEANAQRNTLEKNLTKYGQILLIDEWIKENDLSSAIKFFTKKNNELDQRKINLLNHPKFYPKKVFLICLAIRCTDERIKLEIREAFILALLDPEIVNGYNSTEGWITAPLLEAARSNYRYASNILELLCDYGVNIFKPCGAQKKDELPNYVLIWIYASLLDNNDDEMLYRATLLIGYLAAIPKHITSFLEHEHNNAYKAVHNKVKEVAVSRIKRNEILTAVHSHAIKQWSLARLVCQYSGLYSPASSDSSPIVNVSIPISSLEESVAGSRAEKTEYQKEQVGLKKYNPLPDYKRLERAISPPIAIPSVFVG